MHYTVALFPSWNWTSMPHRTSFISKMHCSYTYKTHVRLVKFFGKHHPHYAQRDITKESYIEFLLHPKTKWSWRAVTSDQGQDMSIAVYNGQYDLTQSQLLITDQIIKNHARECPWHHLSGENEKCNFKTRTAEDNVRLCAGIRQRPNHEDVA